MFLLTVIWILLILAVAVLVIMKKRIAGPDDETLHVSHVSELNQNISAKKHSAELLDRFDRWTLGLSISIIAYGVLLLARYLYVAWQQGPNFNW